MQIVTAQLHKSLSSMFQNMECVSLYSPMYLKMDVTELGHKTQPGETRGCQNYGGRVGKKKVSLLLFATFRFRDLLKVVWC